MGAGSDFTITHSGTGATLTANPLHITSKAAAGKTTGGALTINGKTGVNIQEDGDNIR